MKILIALVAAVVLASIVGVIYVGSRSYERTVVADPYGHAVHHDADRRKALELGWTLAVDEAALRAGPEVQLVATLAGKGGAPLDGAEVTFRVSRPGTSRLDASARATAEGAGRYVALLPLPDPGFWDLDAVVKRDGQTLILEQRVHVGGGTADPAPCDAGVRSCAAEAGPLRIVLALSPRPPVPLKEIEAKVELLRDGAAVEGAEVSVLLSMPGMYMGENRILLRPAGNGRYAGQGALLRCASGRRDWLAEVEVRIPGMPGSRARFPFQAAE
ncbi:MAG: FixH family protein [Deltaproteobacteria bacterium]